MYARLYQDEIMKMDSLHLIINLLPCHCFGLHGMPFKENETHETCTKHGFSPSVTCSWRYKISWAMFSSQKVFQKTSHRIFGHIHEVLNKIYLQNFLHG